MDWRVEMTKQEAQKILSDAHDYLKYQDNKKFPLKAKKHLPMETLKALAVFEAALQVDYKLCPVKHLIAELNMLKQNDKTSRGKLIDKTIDSCIAVVKDVMSYGTNKKK